MQYTEFQQCMSEGSNDKYKIPNNLSNKWFLNEQKLLKLV
jgi:hypothetical protein